MGGNKHISSACLSCRRRKIKCDGNEICSNCALSKLDCVYNAEADLRRASAKENANNLRARLAQLEEVLRKNNIEVPIPEQTDPNSRSSRAARSQRSHSGTLSSEDRDESAGKLMDRQRAEDSQDGNEPGRSSMSPMHGPSPLSETMPPVAERPTVGHGFSSSDVATGEYNRFDASAQNAFSMQSLGDNSFRATSLPRSEPSVDSMPAMDFNSSQADVSDDEGDITHFLAARMGSLRIAEDGQLRYYGPTSNLHVHPDGFHSLQRSSIRHVATEGGAVLRQLGLDHEVRLDLEVHLARIYFSWEDPAIHVVDEATYFAEKQRWVSGDKSSPYYSETLNNAICAVGACLATSDCLDLPQPAPEFFSARAKALLDVEMDSPTVATVQALVIMSASEAAFTRDARGFLYSGMASRLSTDLGLHLDLTRHNGRHLLSPHDLEIRQMAFWGVFIHDNMWRLYVGRPWGIDIPDITVAKPLAVLDDIRGKTWSPYPKANGQSIIPEGGIYFPLEACTAANVGLCEHMQRINTGLYSGRRMELPSLVEFLSDMRKSLSAWEETLPASLRIDPSRADTPYVPAVLQLHMQYYATLIALYRPYLSSQLNRVCDAIGTHEQQAALREAHAECIAAAHKTAETLRCYQKQHSLIRSNVQIVHIIFTASLVLIYHFCTRPFPESQASLDDLQFCCQSLGEVGQSYGNAKRALEVIITIKTEWQRMAAPTRPLGNLGIKRPSVGISSASPFQFGQSWDGRGKRRSYPRGPSSMEEAEQPLFLMPALTTLQMGQGGDIGHIPMLGPEQMLDDAWQNLYNTGLINSVDATMGMANASPSLQEALPSDQTVQQNPANQTSWYQAGTDGGASSENTWGQDIAE
ncbi:fungal-specific transcription factor domain-containing protein [Coniochaeta sp. 2T2.1]|nr:fungal-specific transcription factor domain-containing protein [Coniochaeta sp. 2T2.1]